MELKYTEIRLQITPESAKLLAAGLIEFAEKIENKIAKGYREQMVMPFLSDNRDLGISFEWKSLKPTTRNANQQ